MIKRIIGLLMAIFKKQNGQKPKAATYTSETAIRKFITTYYGRSWEVIKSPTRKREVLEARQFYCFLCARHASLSSRYISVLLGGKHDSTVRHSIIKVTRLLSVQDQRFTEAYEKFKTLTT